MNKSLIVLYAFLIGCATNSRAEVLVRVTEGDFDNIITELVGEPGESGKLRHMEVIEAKAASGGGYVYLIYKDGFHYALRAASRKSFDSPKIKILQAILAGTSGRVDLTSMYP